VYGSGAKGFCDAVKRHSGGTLFKELLIFAHPPLSAVKNGYVRVMGAITACAPVGYAKGSHMAAVTARATEGRICDEGHAVFLKAIGAQETSVEWSVIHIGEGHTSISCHTEWEERRTTMNDGALPGRFVVAVRDASEPVMPIEDGAEDDSVVDIDGLLDDSAAAPGDVPGLVRVSNGGKVGSGMVMNAGRLILTAAHVVDGADKVRVKFGDGADVEADVIYQDEDPDVAFLSILDMEGIITASPGHCESLEPGDRVIAYGYPADPRYRDVPVATSGVVLDILADGPYTIVQTDAAVRPGCSGGPLLTPDGNFVGMITSRCPKQGTSAQVTCALSSEDIFDVMAEYESHLQDGAVDARRSVRVPMSRTSNHKEEVEVLMGRIRNYSPPVKPKQWKSKARSRVRQENVPWVDAIVKGLRQGNGFLVLVTSPSNSEDDHRRTDDQLAEIAVMQSRINNETSSGKEISALKDLVGYPPYTFSKVGSFYRGAVVSLVQSWEEDGMPTLLDMSVFPPESEEESRTAVLYGVGEADELNSLENAFLEYFRPTNYAKCFSDAVPDQDGFTHGAKFFVQWELFQDEAACALGIPEDSPQLGVILDQLEKQATSLRQPEGKKSKQTISSRAFPVIGRRKL